LVLQETACIGAYTISTHVKCIEVCKCRYGVIASSQDSCSSGCQFETVTKIFGPRCPKNLIKVETYAASVLYWCLKSARLPAEELRKRLVVVRHGGQLKVEGQVHKCLVLDPLPTGSEQLHQRLLRCTGGMSKVQVQRIIRQLLVAVQLLEQPKFSIVSFTLHPQDLAISPAEPGSSLFDVAICGLADCVLTRQAQMICGADTPAHAAPNCQPDLWAIGKLLCELLADGPLTKEKALKAGQHSSAQQQQQQHRSDSDQLETKNQEQCFAAYAKQPLDSHTGLQPAWKTPPMLSARGFVQRCHTRGVPASQLLQHPWLRAAERLEPPASSTAGTAATDVGAATAAAGAATAAAGAAPTGAAGVGRHDAGMPNSSSGVATASQTAAQHSRAKGAAAAATSGSVWSPTAATQQRTARHCSGHYAGCRCFCGQGDSP
jgi:hypothetical protein